jgi:nucleoside-diphosphate-sugar epimerase
MALLITGCAGFIGSHLASFLLDRGERVIGIDNLNPYYDVALKHARLARLQANSQFTFHQIDIADEAAVTDLFAGYSDISAILHLAAQAGVRYSLSNPLVYVEANVKGQVVLLEAARRLSGLKSFVYASSSSVYGDNQKHRFVSAIQSTARYLSMRQPSGPGNWSPRAIAGFTIFPAPGCAFSRYTALGAGRTWPTTYSPRQFSPAGRSRCSTRAAWLAISPM